MGLLLYTGLGKSVIGFDINLKSFLTFFYPSLHVHFTTGKATILTLVQPYGTNVIF